MVIRRHSLSSTFARPIGRVAARPGELLLQLLPSALTRSVLLELGKTFLTSLVVITSLVIVILLGEVNLQYDLGVGTCFRLMPFVLPRALAYAVSAAWMFAVCTVFGSMAASNELLALKAAGISPFRLVRPALVFAAGLTFPTIWLMDVANSRAKDGIQQVVIESAPDIAFRSLRSTGSFRSKNLSLAVTDVQGQKLIQPTVLFYPSGEDCHLTAMAELAELECDPRQQQGCLRLVNGTATNNAGYTLRFSDAVAFPVSFGDLNRNAIFQHYTLQELPGAIAVQRRRVHQLEALLERNTAGASTPERTAARERTQPLCQQLAEERYSLFRLKCFQHRRCSQGFCCLSFTIFGWPLAVLLRRKNIVTTFFLSFLPILLFFYPMEFQLARMSSLPPGSLWLCHVILILAGLCLFCRVWKH